VFPLPTYIAFDRGVPTKQTSNLLAYADARVRVDVDSAGPGRPTAALMSLSAASGAQSQRHSSEYATSRVRVRVAELDEIGFGASLPDSGK